MYAIHFYVPNSHLEAVKTAMFAAGAGQIGAYDSCAWQTKGQGQFRPLDGSKPFIGRKGEVEGVDEWKVEMVCDDDRVEAAVAAMKQAHPYETPAYLVWQCANL